MPFIALAAVQVLVIALAPSRGPAGFAGGSQYAGGVGGPGAAGSGTAQAAALNGGGSGANGSALGGTGAAGGSFGSGGSGGGFSSGGISGPGGVADRSDCAANGNQIGPTGYEYMPPCVPVWHGGDNGGATMNGVDSTHIRYVLYKPSANAEVNAILATQNLAASAEQSCEAAQIFNDVINKYWSTYGRRFTPVDGPGANKGSTKQSPCNFPYFQSTCSLTPPDPPCEVADAKVIASLHPAIVIGAGVTSQFSNQLAAEGIINIGGGEDPESYYDQDAPYFYGLLMDGSRQAHFDAELWCRQLANKPVKWAGSDVQTTRNWGATIGAPPTRKLAAIFPATNGDPTTKISVDIFKSYVTGKMCNTQGGLLEIPYQSDINTAQQQTDATVQELIQNHITTVICFCDPIAPVFLTNGEQQQNYFPEQLIAGVGLIDYDVLGRLYAAGEWQHAFGISDLTTQVPIQQSWSYQWYRADNNSGTPDNTEDAVVPVFSTMATMFQVAGPQPNPVRIHQGLQALPAFGGWQRSHNQYLYEIGFKDPSPWTAAEDVRTVNWNATRPSEVDGKAGSYCPIAKGERFDLGTVPGNVDFFDTNGNGC